MNHSNCCKEITDTNMINNDKTNKGIIELKHLKKQEKNQKKSIKKECVLNI